MYDCNKKKPKKLNLSGWPQNSSCHVLRKGREETQRTVGALSGASFGGGTKGRAELTGFDVRILTQTFTSSLPLGLDMLKLRSRPELGESRLDGIYASGIFSDWQGPVDFISEHSEKQVETSSRLLDGFCLVFLTFWLSSKIARDWRVANVVPHLLQKGGSRKEEEKEGRQRSMINFHY